MGDELRVHVTWFAAPSRWNTTGQRRAIAWDELVAWLRSPELWPGGGSIEAAEDRLPGLSMARYRNDSRVAAPGEDPLLAESDRVEEVWGLLLEYTSDPTVDAAQLIERWGHWRFVAWTTAWHEQAWGEQPPGPRWRVLLPFRRSVDRETAERVAAWAAHPRRRAGVLDPRSADVGRFEATPSLAPGGFEAAASKDGEWLDPADCVTELAGWLDAERHARARDVLRGTGIQDAARGLIRRSGGAIPWPDELDPGVPLRVQQLVTVQSARIGLRRTMALAVARTAALAGHPVLHVTTSASKDEVLARLLGLADPSLHWRALAEGRTAPAEIERRAAALATAAPELHLWAPTASQRSLDALREEWAALAEATQRGGLVVIDDPADLVSDGAEGLRRAGLALRDLAAEGHGVAVLLATDGVTASQLRADLGLAVQAEGIAVDGPDGVIGRLPVAIDPGTGAVTSAEQLSLQAAPG